MGLVPVILDLDATVVDTDSSYIHQKLNSASHALGGHTIERAQAIKIWKSKNRDELAIMYSGIADKYQFWKVFQHFDTANERLAYTTVCQDVVRMLQFWREKGAEYGIITGGTRGIAEAEVRMLEDELGGGIWFDNIICAGQDLNTPKKPDPKNIINLLNTIAPSEYWDRAVLFGDSLEEDIEMVNLTRAVAQQVRASAAIHPTDNHNGVRALADMRSILVTYGRKYDPASLIQYKPSLVAHTLADANQLMLRLLR